MRKQPLHVLHQAGRRPGILDVLAILVHERFQRVPRQALQQSAASLVDLLERGPIAHHRVEISRPIAFEARQHGLRDIAVLARQLLQALVLGAQRVELGNDRLA